MLPISSSNSNQEIRTTLPTNQQPTSLLSEIVYTLFQLSPDLNIADEWPKLKNKEDIECLSNPSLLADKLEKLLKEREVTIEALIKDLEKSQKEEKLISATLEIKKFADNYINSFILISGWISDPILLDLLKNIPFNTGIEKIPLKEIQNYGNALKKLIEKINKNFLWAYLQKSHHLFHSAGVCLEAFDIGVNGLNLIFQAQILKEAKKKLGQISQFLEEYKNQGLPLPLKVDKEIKEWRATIESGEKALTHDITEYSWQITDRIFFNIKLINYLLPTQIITPEIQLILQNIGWASSAFSLIYFAINLKKTAGDYSINQEELRKLREMTTTITMNGQPLNDLLTKRKNWFNEQKQNLEKLNNEELQSKLKNFEKAKFDREFDKEFNNKLNLILLKLRSPDSPFNADIIKKELQILGISFSFSQNKQLSTRDKFIKYLSELKEDKVYLDLVKKNIKNEPSYQKKFQKWYQMQDHSLIIPSYLEYQETISQTLKGAIKEIIHTKHTIENTFLKLKLIRSGTLFTILACSAIASVILILLGLALTPIGPLVLLATSLLTTAVGLGIIGIGFYFLHKKKPSVGEKHLKAIETRTRCAELMAGIRHYSLDSKRKKFLDVASITLNLFQKLANSSLNSQECKETQLQYEKSVKNFENTKKEALICQRKVDYWNRRVENLHQELLNSHWEDFSEQANLVRSAHSPFDLDTLTSLNEFLKTCDFSILDPELKILLEKLPAVDISEPETFIKALLRFIAFNDSELIHFMHHQQVRRTKEALS